MGKNFYDDNYYKFLEGSSAPENGGTGTNREIEFLKKFISSPKGKTILDLGCGTGRFLESLKNSGADLWGIDISSTATSLARKRVPAAEQVICCDASPLPFEDERFDYVTSWGVIEHFHDIPKAISEIKRVMKQDATALIMVPNVYYYKFVWDAFRNGGGPAKHQEIEKLYSFGEWKALIEREGLEVVRVSRHNKFNKSGIMVWLRDKLIPFYFSNHFVFVCRKQGK